MAGITLPIFFSSPSPLRVCRIFGLWQFATLALYLGALSTPLRIHCAGIVPALWLLLATAFPAVFVNLTHGDNGS